jgi:hypothetical protein
METVNTRINQTDLLKLSLNTIRWLHRSETVEATKHLNQHKIPFRIILSGEGYWINVSWKNGIIAPLTYLELVQLPDYLSFHPKPRNQNA